MVGREMGEIDGLEVGLEQDTARRCLLAMLAAGRDLPFFILCNQLTWKDLR